MTAARVCLLLSFAALGQEPHPDCSFFGPERERFLRPALDLTQRTEEVTRARPTRRHELGPPSFSEPERLGFIDRHLWSDMQAAGVKPAAKTTDLEFIRRVTLDLTGRIPAPERVLAFVAATEPDKRAALVEALLTSPEWVDKWTMFFGDLYKNTDIRPSSGTRRFGEGRNAFYHWIKESLANRKPYHQMASELIAAEGANSYRQGELNWLVGGVVGGGPVQDIVDQQAANVAETFLGITHMNCLLCHNGRGHLDTQSLWGRDATRAQAWGFASFLSRTNLTRTRVDPNNPNIYYWVVIDDGARDYTLGSTTGNRPARNLLSSCTPGRTCTVPPVYPFTGEGPASGEGHRTALARLVTSDLQFARASVNYIWAELFGRGLVDPPNQFDPARLNPDNPPPAPWSLQPSNPRLLNALAEFFVESQYDLRALMRQIVNSEAYQLSSRYEGRWDPAWEKLFARKFARRLWAEEVHDAVVQSSGVMPRYNVAGLEAISWAMQLPDTVNMGPSAFLDSFFRGNRDDTERKREGSLLQALNLMNDGFVISRTQTSHQILTANLGKSDNELIDALWLGILSRLPSEEERTAGRKALATGNRGQSARNLVWSLYNKVDFIFNY